MVWTKSWDVCEMWKCASSDSHKSQHELEIGFTLSDLLLERSNALSHHFLHEDHVGEAEKCGQTTLQNRVVCRNVNESGWKFDGLVQFFLTGVGFHLHDTFGAVDDVKKEKMMPIKGSAIIWCVKFEKTRNAIIGPLAQRRIPMLSMV